MELDIFQHVEAFREEMDPTVTGVTLGALFVFVGLRLGFPQRMAMEIIPGVRTGMLDVFGPLFLGLMVAFVLFAVVIVVGPWGAIRLGGDDATPAYSYPAYFAMVFSAGIAAGIVFWAPAEALFHYGSPPPFVGAAAETTGAAQGALATVFFHWGVSAWSAYVAVALPVAYYAYNRGAPLRVSTVLAPFLGTDSADHPLAKTIDILAVFATIGGVGTSVGFVGTQFLSGVEYQWGVGTSALDTFVVVAGLTVVFTVSVVTGVKRGIRRLSGVNVTLFGLTMALLLVLGPTAYILTGGARALVGYATTFPTASLGPAVLGGGGEWYNAWTLFYWVWWFSWAPFAGLFLASISRGRTLRTVALTGAGASSAATLAWFTVVSGTALQLQAAGTVDVLAAIGESGYEVAGFPLLAALPLGELLVVLFFALIVTWIATSGDTSTLTNAVLATEPGVAPGTATRVFWGFLQGAFGFGLITIGAANALQSAAVITGGPFGVVVLAGVLGLLADLVRPERGESTPIPLGQEGD